MNLNALWPSRHILGVLALLSVWIWIMAVVTLMNLAREKKGGSSSSLPGYRDFCRNIISSRLRPKTGRRLMEIYGKTILNRTAGNVGTILLLSSVAPLLGLLGTVDGMIDTFSILALSGTGDSTQLTTGISKALVTTQGGLLVAIPGVLAGGILYRKSKKLKNRLALVRQGERP